MKKTIAFFIVLVLIVVVFGLDFSPAAAEDLTIPIEGRVSIELISSNAAFSNTLSEVSTISVTARIAASGCNLEPSTGLVGLLLLSEKISQRGCRVVLDADRGTSGIDGFPANTNFEFALCAQLNTDENCEYVWFSNPSNNEDNFDHVHTTNLAPGIYQLAWEDQPDGGDMDFDDLIVVVRVEADADGDGLWDDWEQSGIDTNGDGLVDYDLPALGANSNRKDIFLEVDYTDCTVTGGDCPAGDTHTHRPKQAAIDAVVAAFANAPVTNPDGSTGITLRVDVDDAIPHQLILGLGCDGTVNNFDTLKADPAFFGYTNPRRFTHHYVIWGHRQGITKGSSGCGEVFGNDFIVTLGDWNTACIGSGSDGTLDTTNLAGDDFSDSFIVLTGPNLICDTTAALRDDQLIPVGSSPPSDRDGDGLDDWTVGTIQQQAGTFIHEFGHNLSLDHGGGDGINSKPNYLSLMNYAFQIRGIFPDPDGTGPLEGQVDYSGSDLADLDENSLNEQAGISDGTDNTFYFCPDLTIVIGPGSGAVDWDCDNDNGVETSVSADITGGFNDIDGDNIRDSGEPLLGVLPGFNDWISLKYDFQSSGDFEDGVHQSVTHHVDIDYHTSLQIPRSVQIDIKPGTDVNSVNCNNGEIITVAILTTDDFDALSVIHTSVRFTGAREIHVGRNGIPRRHVEDVDLDGDLDLIFHFRLGDSSLACTSTVGTLVGITNIGSAIVGSDSVNMVP